MQNKQTIWIIITATLGVIIVVAAYFIFRQQDQIEGFKQQSELVKEELSDDLNKLSDDYNNLSLQNGEFKLTINNDSLAAKLETEQAKVQRLQEELRTVKSTNTKRINELKKELETLRTIMRHYVVQIDSLNKVNESLVNENKQITTKYHQATRTASQLAQDKEHLIETVNMASKLDASNISVVGIMDNNKVTDKIKKMAQLKVTFTINKNITAPRGEKTIYIRIKKPDDDVLVKNRANVFTYEGKEISYSAKRTFEYTGEEFVLPIFWPIEEYLTPGDYRVDIFADGNRIGQKSFKLEK
jgi:protoporphyrinogen oxidase